MTGKKKNDICDVYLYTNRSTTYCNELEEY